jgi:hypothetical protein
LKATDEYVSVAPRPEEEEVANPFIARHLRLGRFQDGARSVLDLLEMQKIRDAYVYQLWMVLG